ncbi:MAG TPA: hypothetical protein VFT50_06355 [Baekduia sp.]|nr:hypothetical protein [Baekduia sp.]
MSERWRDRRLWSVAAGLVVLAGVVALAATWLWRDRSVVAAVPQPPAIEHVALVTVPPRANACLDGITLPPDGEVALMQAGTMGQPPTPLTVVASGADGYRSVTRVPPTWTDNGELYVRLRPPANDVPGRLCVRNRGRHDIALYGADDRAQTVAVTTVDGKPVTGNFDLTLLEARPSSIADHVGEIASDLGTFRPIGGTGLMVVLGLLVVLGIPVLLVWSFVRALGEDG